MIRVVLDHQLVDEWPSDHRNAVDGGDLLIYGPELRLLDTMGRPLRQLMKRYPQGAWHGAGEGILCASIEPSDCEVCAPKPS